MQTAQPNQTPKRREKNRGPKTDLSGTHFMQNLLSQIRQIRINATQPKQETTP